MSAFRGRTGGDTEKLAAVAAPAAEEDARLLAAIRALDDALRDYSAAAEPGYRLHDHSVTDLLDRHRRWRRALDDWAGELGAALAAADRRPGPRRLAEAPASSLTQLGGAPRTAPRHGIADLSPDELDERLRSLLRGWSEGPLPEGQRPRVDSSRRSDRRRVLEGLSTGDFSTTANGHRIRVVSVAVGPEGETELQLLVGDPSVAQAALTWTPGTGHGVHSFEVDLAVADAWVDFGVQNDQPVAVLVDLYDGPDHVLPAVAAGDGLLGEAAAPSYAQAHVDALRGGVDRLVSWLPPKTRVTAVAHSYGVVSLGHAAAEGLDVDALVLLAGPGAGVREAADFQLREGADVWAVRAVADPIQIAADLDESLSTASTLPGASVLLGMLGPALAHGPDPTDHDFGADAYQLSPPGGEPVIGHAQTGYVQSEYAVMQLMTIAIGREPIRPTVDDAAALREQLGYPAYGLGTDGTRVEDR